MQSGPCMKVADMETLLSRLRASQFHLQGSAQRGMGPHAAMLAGSEGDAEAHARYYSVFANADPACLTG